MLPETKLLPSCLPYVACSCFPKLHKHVKAIELVNGIVTFEFIHKVDSGIQSLGGSIVG